MKRKGYLTRMLRRLIGILVLAVVVLAMVQVVGAETAHVATHVVISEFATRGSDSAYDEFVELYNPTGSEIDISGWKLQYWSGSSWGNKLAVPADTEIPSHCFYLMASSSTYFKTTTADIYHSTYFGFKDALAEDDPRGIRILDENSAVVDTVVYGGSGGTDDPDNQAEGDTLAPSQGEASYSVERKAITSSDSTKMAFGGDHYTWGNGEDTNNNGNDFVRQTNGREPQNSSSDTEDCPAQSWFLHNDSVMYKENMSKPQDTVTVSDSSSTVWKANEPATVDVGFPGGNWTGTITLDVAFTSDKTFTVEVGSYAGSIFTSAGSQTCTGDGSTTSFSLDFSATAFDISKDDYLALNITNPSDGSAALVVKTGDGNSYVISPETDPGYPVPELPTLILFSTGLIALAGYVLLTRRRK